MFFNEFIISDKIDTYEFFNNLYNLKRFNFDSDGLAETEHIYIDENHYNLLKCNSAQEIIDKNLHHLLNNKISLPFKNTQTNTNYKVSLTFLHIAFSAKNELRDSLFNLMNEKLKSLLLDIKETPFDSGNKESIIRKKMIALNCPFITNYLNIKQNKDYLKLFLNEEVITQNPYLILLSTAPFEPYKFSQYISIMNKNNLLYMDVVKYCLSPFNIFRLSEDNFDLNFVNFLKKENLFDITRDYNFNSKNLKLQSQGNEKNKLSLNLADHFYLKENKSLVNFLEKEGLSINFDFHLLIDLHKQVLIENNPMRDSTNKKLLERIASLENLVIKETTKNYFNNNIIKKRL